MGRIFVIPIEIEKPKNKTLFENLKSTDHSDHIEIQTCFYAFSVEIGEYKNFLGGKYFEKKVNHQRSSFNRNLILLLFHDPARCGDSGR